MQTLPWDEGALRSGRSDQAPLLAGEEPSAGSSSGWPSESDPTVLPECVRSSLEIKKPYIEKDEHDTGIRNLLNYGHTSATPRIGDPLRIPHGNRCHACVLTATYISAQMELVTEAYFQELKTALAPWHQPYEQN